MAKNNRDTQTTSPEAVISIIGKGMTLTGDCETDGALRIEGTVKGNVRAGKAVVIGKEGLVDGNIYTQDAVISGRVLGSVHAHSRLELQATSQISGEIEARRMQLEEGATVQGQVTVGEAQTEIKPVESPRPGAVSEGTPEGGVGGQGISGGSSSSRVAHGGASVASASPAVSPRVTHPNRPEQRSVQDEGRSTHVQQQQQQSPPTTLPT